MTASRRRLTGIDATSAPETPQDPPFKREGHASPPDAPAAASVVPTWLRAVSIPRFALRRAEAAASLGISVALLNNWISAGLMPRPRKIGGVALFDASEIAAAWSALAAEPEAETADSATNPFDGLAL